LRPHPFRYVASRIFLHNPPGEGNAFRTAPNAPKEIHDHENHLATAEPEVNPWFCVVFLVITIAVMATTAEWVSYCNPLLLKLCGLGTD
jgi:Ca2+:H+ antiporter